MTAATVDERVAAVAAALLDHRQFVAPQGAPVATTDEERRRLSFQLGAAWRAFQAAAYGRASRLLPQVLRRLGEGSSAEGAEQQALLASALHAAAAVLAHLGAADLAWVSAERGLRVAQGVDRPVPVAALSRSVAHALVASGRPREALALTHAAAEGSRGQVASRPEPVALSVHGTLLLNGAMAAARSGERQEALDLIAEAGAVADRLGGEHNEAWTAFGPANVALHRVGVAVEVDDVDRALRLGVSMDARGAAGRATRPPRPRCGPGGDATRSPPIRRRPAHRRGAHGTGAAAPAPVRHAVGARSPPRPGGPTP